jgi:hypothetical protein
MEVIKKVMQDLADAANRLSKFKHDELAEAYCQGGGYSDDDVINTIIDDAIHDIVNYKLVKIDGD